MAQSEERVPKVFISYSHDSPDHNKWVAALAELLIKNGVDVILDQWELRLGDDVPKFMERGVRIADRVLVICTEAYVRKADGGEGGAGYEAMIVTGELIRNLGSSKFIPIIKQDNNDMLPSALSTRFYVNLSNPESYDEEFERLLRELHEVATMSKPVLGKNPFAKKPSGAEIPSSAESTKSLKSILDGLGKGDDIYFSALEIARQGDLIAWRKLIQAVKRPVPELIHAWLDGPGATVPNDYKDYPELLTSLVNIYIPLILVVIAGIESGRDRFNNHIGLIDEIVNPPGWPNSGRKYIVEMPLSVAFCFQAIHGAICINTGQLPLALKLAKAKLVSPYSADRFDLYHIGGIIGWPSALDGNCGEGWKYIASIKRWPTIANAFGRQEDYLGSLCGYYMLLHYMEFLEALVALGEEKFTKLDQYSLDVPLIFMTEDEPVLAMGYGYLLQNKEWLSVIHAEYNVSPEAVRRQWPNWIKRGEAWLLRVFSSGLAAHRYGSMMRNFLSDIGR